MKVAYYLMRHAEPTPGHPMDATRELTANGQRQAVEMASFLKGHIGRVDVVISSPFTRAMQTAEVMADALGAHVVSTTLLEPDQEPEQMWPNIERIAQASSHVLLVGHDPSINKLLAWLIAGGNVRFEHGAIAHVTVAAKDQDTHPRVEAKLHWLVNVPIVERDVEHEIEEAARALVESLS